VNSELIVLEYYETDDYCGLHRISFDPETRELHVEYETLSGWYLCNSSAHLPTINDEERKP
jgi:hypothetical protein